MSETSSKQSRDFGRGFQRYYIPREFGRAEYILYPQIQDQVFHSLVNGIMKSKKNKKRSRLHSRRVRQEKILLNEISDELLDSAIHGVVKTTAKSLKAAAAFERSTFQELGDEIREEIEETIHGLKGHLEDRFTGGEKQDRLETGDDNVLHKSGSNEDSTYAADTAVTDDETAQTGDLEEVPNVEQPTGSFSAFTQCFGDINCQDIYCGAGKKINSNVEEYEEYEECDDSISELVEEDDRDSLAEDSELESVHEAQPRDSDRKKWKNKVFQRRRN